MLSAGGIWVYVSAGTILVVFLLSLKLLKNT